MAVHTDLEAFLRDQLEATVCCMDLQECIAAERSRLHAFGQPLRMTLASMDSITPADERAWNHFWTEYYPHILGCDNKAHPVALIQTFERRDEGPTVAVTLAALDQAAVHLAGCQGLVLPSGAIIR